MVTEWLAHILATARAHRRAVGIGMGVLAALAAIALTIVRFEGRLEIMLPEGSEARRMLRFLQEADFADKVAITLKADSPEILTAAMDTLSGRLDAAWISRQIRPPQGADIMADLVFFLDHSGELLGGDTLAGLEQRLTAEAVGQHLRQCYLRMLRPEGSFSQPVVRRDPLGISTLILARLDALTTAFGYRVAVRNGHLVDAEGRHGLILLETTVPMTDAAGAKRLVADLEAELANLPAGIEAEFVCGHLHSVSNEQLLRRDIRLTMLVATAGFLLLFLGLFRDLRAGIIFLIPAVCILVSLSVSAILLGTLSYLVIGFGAVMAGIAVDYGIHVYVARRFSPEGDRAVVAIVRPLLLGALTTLCVFIAFFFSRIPGYRQLGVFSVISIALSLLGALFLLPAFVEPRQDRFGPLTWFTWRVSRRQALALAWVFLGSLLLAGGGITQLRFDADLQRLDGTAAPILAAEQRFREIWGGGEQSQAIAVVQGATYEIAARTSDQLYASVKKAHPEQLLISLSSLWPARETRRENLLAWRQFWQPERVAALRTMIRETGEPYGFSDTAFAPFFDLLEVDEQVAAEPGDSPILDSLRDRFVQQTADGWRIMSFFPDTGQALATMRQVMTDHPTAFIVSQRSLGDTLSRSMTNEIARISAIGLGLMLVVTFVLLGSIRRALAAMLPAAVGVLWLLGIMGVTGISLNVGNLVAGIVVIGLCIDYGIFVTHACTSSDAQARLPGIRLAVTLSAVTTLIGAGVLLIARHPALFAIGLTLVVGIGAGYLAALLGVPGLCLLLGISKEPGKGRGLRTLVMVALLGGALCGCRSIPFEQPELQRLHGVDPVVVRTVFAAALPPRMEVANTVVFDYRWQQIAALGYAKIDRPSRAFEILCLNHVGVQLFHLAGKGDEYELKFALPDFTERGNFLEAVSEDIKRIYFDLVPAADASVDVQPRTIVFRQPWQSGELVYVFGGPHNLLLEKRWSAGGRLKWRVRFFEYQWIDGMAVPMGIVLENQAHRYRLITRNRDIMVRSEWEPDDP